MRQIILLLFLAMPLISFSQNAFIDKLTRQADGQGTVKVIQEAEISDLVNGRLSPAGALSTPSGRSGQQPSNVLHSARKMKTQGYRIQVFAGGNSRTSRSEAQKMAAKVKDYFGDLSVYTHFQSPRWICRVGDFRTYEEASAMLREMKSTGQFSEALIVKSTILISY